MQGVALLSSLSQGRKLMGTLVLSLLALAGNYFNLSLLFGLDFVFGSIAVMLAILVLGPLAALVVALVGGAYTWVLWGVPYPFMVFTLEALVVAWWYQRQIRQKDGSPNLVVINLAFWALLGFPLILLIYKGWLGFAWNAAVMIALKQSVNGVFNALVASGLVLLLKINRPQAWTVSLQQLLFHVLLGITLITVSVPTLYSTYFKQAELEASLQQQLEQQAQVLLNYWNYWGETQSALHLWGKPLLPVTFVEEVSVSLVASTGEFFPITGSAPKVETPGQLLPAEGGLQVWLPEGQMSAVRRWALGRYVYSRELPPEAGEGQLHLEVPTQEVVDLLEQKRLELLYLLAGLSLLTILLSSLLSRWVSRPLAALNQQGRHLADQLQDQQQVQLSTETSVREYRALTETLQSMSDRLATAFKKQQLYQSSLEDQVTQRTQALAEEKKRFESFFTVNLDLLCIADLDGYFLQVNPAWTWTLGYSMEELETLRFLDLVHPEDMADTLKAMQRLEQQEKVLDFVNRYRCKDGSYRFIEWRSQPDGQVIYSAARDISAHRELEKTLREARLEAEQASETKSRFLANMGHEIRTPMNAILTSARQLAEAQPQSSDYQQQAKLLLQSSESLMRLLNDLLDFSRLEAGADNLSDHEFQPENLLQQVQALYFAEAREKSLQLTCDWQGPPGASFLGDEQRIHQLLANLASNALKFTPEGKVELIAWPLTSESESSGLGLAVVDTGIGIPEDKLDRLFKPFSQVDDSNSRRYGGTGLGLSIVRSLVESMGGEWGVESQPQKGSRFWVTLPLTRGTDNTSSVRAATAFHAPDQNSQQPQNFFSQDEIKAIKETAQSLQEALADHHFDALNLFYRLKKRLKGSNLGTEFTALETAIEKFEYHQALEKLQTWVKNQTEAGVLARHDS